MGHPGELDFFLWEWRRNRIVQGGGGQQQAHGMTKQAGQMRRGAGGSHCEPKSLIDSAAVGQSEPTRSKPDWTRRKIERLGQTVRIQETDTLDSVQSYARILPPPLFTLSWPPSLAA